MCGQYFWFLLPLKPKTLSLNCCKTLRAIAHRGLLGEWMWVTPGSKDRLVQSWFFFCKNWFFKYRMHSFLIEMVFKILTYSTGNGRENDFLLKYLPISAFISKSSFETISKRVKCKARSKKILDQIRKNKSGPGLLNG